MITLRRVGQVETPEGPVVVRVEKTITFRSGAPGMAIAYVVENMGERRLGGRFGVEFNVNLLAGDAPDRTLRVYASLHDAALGFCERHLKRMSKHVARATVAGVPNFMHMALAIGDVLRAQVERALSGLGGTKRPIDAEEWNAHRLRLGQYVTTFRDCVDLLQDRYVPALRTLFGPSQLKTAFEDDAAPMRTLCDAFLTVRDRVESFRVGTLRVRIPSGKLIVPGIFNHDVVSVATWKRIAPKIQRAREVLVQLEAAA